MNNKNLVSDFEVIDYLSDDEETYGVKPTENNINITTNNQTSNSHENSSAALSKHGIGTGGGIRKESSDRSNERYDDDDDDEDEEESHLNAAGRAKEKEEDYDDTEFLHKDISKIYTIVFSQTGRTVAIGTEDGLRIQSTEIGGKNSKKYVVEKENNPFQSGVKVVSLLYDTFLCALVTDNKHKAFPDSKVYVWDQINRVIVGEYDFYSSVTAIRYMREYLLVSNDKRLVLYDLVQKKPLKYILDVVNPTNFACSTIYDTFTYAYSADKKGTIVVTNVWFNNPVAIDFNQEVGSTNEGSVRQIEISKLAVSNDGKWIAACELGGHVVKIFDAARGKIKCSLYRGQRPKIITSMEFNRDASILGLISTSAQREWDDGTIHLYDVAFLSSGKQLSSSDKVKDIMSLQFHFDILKKQSYASKETVFQGPMIQFDPKGTSQFTIYSESDYTISQVFDIKSDDQKTRLNDNQKIDGWIDPIQEQQLPAQNN